MTYSVLGKNCPYCQFPIKNESELKWCPVCNSPHHVDCWQENKGCTTFACPAVFKNKDASPSLTVYENSLNVFEINSEKYDTAIWRRIIGFRSLNPWKMLVGILFYLLLTFYFLIELSLLGPDEIYEVYSLLIGVVILPISSVRLAANIIEGEKKVINILIITFSVLLFSLGESNLEATIFLENILIALAIIVTPFILLSLCLFSGINKKPIQRIIVLYFLVLGLILILIMLLNQIL